MQYPAFGHRKSDLIKSRSAHVLKEESFAIHCFDLVSVARVQVFETKSIE